MIGSYEVSFWEDVIERNAGGAITHHPLNGRYIGHDAEGRSSGYLTFGGDGLANSQLLNDVRVFHLWFYGEPYIGQPNFDDQEAWALPIRIEALRKLVRPGYHWYMSFAGWSRDTVITNGFLQRRSALLQGQLSGQQLNRYLVQSQTSYRNLIQREFLEIPLSLLPDAVMTFWQMAVPGHPIEGYLLPIKQGAQLVSWNKRAKTDSLFREVMDTCWMAFYTFPAEHRHLVFLTNKLLLSEMEQTLDIPALQEMARALGQELGKA